MKKQITIHHTASGDGVGGDVAWWQSRSDRIATSYIIDRQGRLHKCFGDDFWAYHLGCKQSHFANAGLPYKKLDPHNIGIELDSWGALLMHTDGKFYPVAYSNGKPVPNLKCKPAANIYEYCANGKYRGFQYYERYTTAQLDTLKHLLLYLMAKHGIKAYYSDDIWHICKRALAGQEGVFSHSSFNPGKSDAHPQIELVNLLKAV
ncbi:N-acetylmuramoyl-L-alanine amidase [Bacteroidales bacterium OttesenSCG-928-B11]|nr:N-acetylmuramoyl-L-alanine amidase [Bacteroidales bacterium OttesenSCG-928-C03]MDL2312643.1 N-acetylmuramoyl-L-alanine amidase [Bacteroidales bacterium OttesenSCG-928-B11]MDL2326114.1 N-acetylmuramoyl-L-alanine amidase [Bacteroidales bacterium OttesenSCG-928-A14]